MTVAEEITMLNKQAEAIRRMRLEMEAELAEITRGTKALGLCLASEDEDEEEETLKGRWTESAGGLCLEVENDEHHPFDPGGWRILAFITFTYRRNAFVVEIGSGVQIGVGLACRRGTFATLNEAKAMVLKATGVEIIDEDFDEVAE